jgi:SulP family sulfate permease
VVGLWAALAPLAVYAVLGSSRQLSVGPESTTALMTATLARLAPRIPGPLIAILAAALVVSLFSLQRNGIKVVGEIPSGLPIPGFSGIPLADLTAMVIPVAGVAIVAFPTTC